MTYAAQINSDHQLCHDPEGGAIDQPLVGDACEACALSGFGTLNKIFHFSFCIFHLSSLGQAAAC